MEIRESKIVSEFLDKKTTNTNTKKNYRNLLRKYFKILDIVDIDNYFKSGRNYTEDIWTVTRAIADCAPKTQKTMLACCKKFLERYDVEIKNREWGDIKTRNNLKKARPVTQKATPNNNDMKTILSYGGIKSRTLFVFACSTGLRVDELLSITFDDIDMKNRSIRIKRDIAKGGVPRDTFFSEEAKELLEKWLPERERYLLRKHKKSMFVRNKFKQEGYELRKKNDCWEVYKNGKPVPKKTLMDMEKRIFPFGYDTIMQTWHRLLEKAGSPYNNKDGKFYLYNLHSLRRFWFTQMEGSGANISHINYMGGHESELNAAYTDFELRDLKETYDKHMNYLAIFSDMDKVDKIIKPKLRAQDAAIASIMRENQKLSDEIDELLKLMYYSTGEPPSTTEAKRIRKLFYDKLVKRLGKEFMDAPSPRPRVH